MLPSSGSRSRGGVAHLSTLFLLSLQASLSIATCDTYTTTGPAGNQTYNNYIFYDFRQLGDQISGQSVYSQDENFPNGQFALSTSTFFNSTAWEDNWSTYTNLVPANHTLSQYVDTVFTPLNVAIEKDNSTVPDGQTVLSLTTNRLNTYSAASQIQTIQKYFHASVRVSMRVMGPPGACASFFIFGDNNNESDMELLTNDTQSIFHATNHPSQNPKGQVIPGASTVTQIPLNGTANGTTPGSWSDWNEWRMDWLEDRTQWIVNGDLVVDKTWSPPKIPGFLALNMWSNGGTWTGNMTVGDTATLQVRWIEIAYNTTTDTPSGNVTCVVDDNNDANNDAAMAGNTVSGSSRISITSLSWLLIAGASLWSLL